MTADQKNNGRIAGFQRKTGNAMADLKQNGRVAGFPRETGNVTAEQKNNGHIAGFKRETGNVTADNLTKNKGRVAGFQRETGNATAEDDEAIEVEKSAGSEKSKIKTRVGIPPSPRSKTTRTYKVGRGEEKLQLMLSLPIRLKNGVEKVISALVDTVAQANLIREGIVPTHLTTLTQRPLELVAANGQIISGGDRETELKIFFSKTDLDGKGHEKRDFCANFHVASIGVDAILSYPWLKEHKIGVFPHLESLALPHREQELLQPTKSSKNPPHKSSPFAHKNIFSCLRVEKGGWKKELEVVEEPTSTFTTPKIKKKRSDSWKTERYRVKTEFVERICGEMGVHPSLDAFADPETNILPHFCGPGSAHEDAFGMS